MTIKEARKRAGLTQKNMSEKLSIPLRTIEDWERGKSNPPSWVEKLLLEKLCSIADTTRMNYPTTSYARVCKKFSFDTSSWQQLDPQKSYYSDSKTWSNRYIDDGIPINWSFHCTDSTIERFAAQYLLNYLLDDIDEALYNENDDLRKTIEEIYSKYIEI